MGGEDGDVEDKCDNDYQRLGASSVLPADFLVIQSR